MHVSLDCNIIYLFPYFIKSCMLMPMSKPFLHFSSKKFSFLLFRCGGQNDHVIFTCYSHDGPDKGFQPICGVLNSLITKRVSDGAYFRVLMSSYDNYEHTGFLGRYEFGPGKYFGFFNGEINQASLVFLLNV